MSNYKTEYYKTSYRKKIKDTWYLGEPYSPQEGLRLGLYHMHAERSGGLKPRMDVVWDISDKVHELTDTCGVPVMACGSCSAIAPDDVVDVALLRGKQ